MRRKRRALIAHSCDGASLRPVSSLPEDRERGESEDDKGSRSDLHAVDLLVREQIPERQREDDRRDEQGLHHRQLPVVERDGLEEIAGEEHERPDEPTTACLASWRYDFAELSMSPIPRAPFLLKGRGEREAEGGDERKYLGHGVEIYADTRRCALVASGDGPNPTRPLFVPVILGTQRNGRMSEHAARLVYTQVAKRPGVETELVDVAALPITVDDAGDGAKDPQFAETMKRADGS